MQDDELKKSEKWKLNIRSFSKDVFDFINEDFDKDVKKLDTVINQFNADLSKRSKGLVEQQKACPAIVDNINCILLQSHQGKISAAKALLRIKTIISRKRYLINGITTIFLEEGPQLKELVKLKSRAIENKEFELAAYYRDEITKLKGFDHFNSLATSFEMDSFFDYWEGGFYYLVKN